MGNNTDPLSLVIISGFLGSGKTTLLKRMLDWEANNGNNPAVIMSEFGELDVDGILLENKDISLKKIFGGCVCCTMKLSLSSTIDELYATGPGKIVYLETTGVADPAGVLEALAPAINVGKVVINKIILVYDASLNQALTEDRQMAEQQLMLADAILINQCDTVEPEECQRAEKYIATIKPNTPLYSTVYADIDPSELLNKTKAIDRDYTRSYVNGKYVSFAFSSQKPFNKNCLSKWLSEIPENVVRVKGIVRFSDEEGVFEVQAVRKIYSIYPLKTVKRYRSVLVAISHDESSKEVIDKLDYCVEG